MNTTHTPGKWEIEYSLDGSTFIECEGNLICHLQTSNDDPLNEDPEMEANARLIKEAPEMYKLIIEIMGVHDRVEILEKANRLISEIQIP